MNDTTLFAFENDFVATLRCIPMAVRFKLDACGTKLSLRQWSRFSQDERKELLLRSCSSEALNAYRTYLARLLTMQGDVEVQPLPPGSAVPWDEIRQTPDAVRAFAASVSVAPPSNGDWAALTPLQRFTLLKLSRDNHDNINFVPAMREFGLLQESLHPAEASYVANA